MCEVYSAGMVGGKAGSWRQQRGGSWAAQLELTATQQPARQLIRISGPPLLVLGAEGLLGEVSNEGSWGGSCHTRANKAPGQDL